MVPVGPDPACLTGEAGGRLSPIRENAIPGGRAIGDDAGMGEVIELRLARELRAIVGNARRLERGALRREVVRIRPGAYVSEEDWVALRESERQLALIDAARRFAKGEPVFSHESAAALHGIPIVGRWPDGVKTTVSRGGGWSSAVVERTHRRLAPEDILELEDGTRATSLVRTLVDLAATRSPLSGVIAISHARRAGVGLAELEDGLARAGRMVGIGSARSALRDSVGGSDSPLETLVVVRCRDLGFAAPEQQRRVRGVDGVDYRVDFAWRDGRVLGEADGKLKYRAVEGAPTPLDVLWAEKRREDALRARCDGFVRVSWEDAWNAAGLEYRLIEAGVPRRRVRGSLTF